MSSKKVLKLRKTIKTKTAKVGKMKNDLKVLKKRTGNSPFTKTLQDTIKEKQLEISEIRSKLVKQIRKERLIPVEKKLGKDVTGIVGKMLNS